MLVYQRVNWKPHGYNFRFGSEQTRCIWIPRPVSSRWIFGSLRIDAWTSRNQLVTLYQCTSYLGNCVYCIYIYTYIYSNIFKYSQIWEQLSCSDHIAAGQLWSNTIKTYKNYSGCSACPWRPWRRQACAPLQPIPRAGWPSWKAWTSKWKGSDQRKHVLYHDVLDVWIIIVQNIYTVIILPISKTNDNRDNYDILIYSWCTMICHAVLEQESWPFVR
jgi:hypothetical protein